MSDRFVTFGCTRLVGTNKEGVLKPDEDGCYTMVIGGLNAYNHGGDRYLLEGAEQFFRKNHAFQRRIARGAVCAEYGHPEFKPGMSGRDFIQRLMVISEKYECATFREIWISKNLLTDNQGRKIVPIWGRFLPTGPYGPALEKKLQAKGQQVCFSIRSLTRNSRNAQGTLDKVITTLITFDLVIEPGIWNAEKLLSPTLESLHEEIRIDVDDIVDYIEEQKLKGSISTESTNSILDELSKTYAKTKKTSSLALQW